MTFPINPIFFDVEVNTHLITEIAAFFLGFRFYVIKKKKTKDPFTGEQRLIILIAAAIGALIFSRLIGALENPKEWYNHSHPWLYLYGTKTVVGGFLGGWLFVEIAKFFMKLKASSGDIMVYPILFALFIGRIGCFSQGIHEMTYGYPTKFMTGMNLGDGILRHPLALYEMVILVLIAVFIYYGNKKNIFKEGMQFKTMMLLYLLYRFFAEWMKPHYSIAFDLTIIQIVIIITYLLNITTFRKKFFQQNSNK